MNPRQQVQSLQNIVSRKGTSKVLTFSVPHVFKALQILNSQKYVRTMILHLKKEKMVDSVRAGTYLTSTGRSLISAMSRIMPAECRVAKCDITRGKFNHALLLKGYSFATKTGMEQRDYAILYGAIGATTLRYHDGRFVFPNDNADCFRDDQKTKENLASCLHPEENDMVIIASADDSFVAEIAAKNSALWTLATHDR